MIIVTSVALYHAADLGETLGGPDGCTTQQVGRHAWGGPWELFGNVHITSHDRPPMPDSWLPQAAQLGGCQLWLRLAARSSFHARSFASRRDQELRCPSLWGVPGRGHGMHAK